MPSKAIELMAFDVFKTVFHRDGERPGPGGTMLSGALAGLCRFAFTFGLACCFTCVHARGQCCRATACQACVLHSQATCRLAT